MLIPFYFLIGMWGTGERVRATTKLVDLHAGRLVLHARRGRSPPACSPPSDHGTDLDLRALLAAAPAAVARLAGVDLPVLRGRVPGEDAAGPVPRLAAPTATSRCRSRRSRCSPASSSKVAAYGFLRIVLPLFPYASVHFQMLMLLIALVSILWATAVAFTTPDARLVVAYSSVAQLGFITLGIFSLRPAGRPGRAAADGQPRPRHRAAVLHRRRARRRAPAAPRCCATWAGSRSARRCSPRCS